MFSQRFANCPSLKPSKIVFMIPGGRLNDGRVDGTGTPTMTGIRYYYFYPLYSVLCILYFVLCTLYLNITFTLSTLRPTPLAIVLLAGMPHCRTLFILLRGNAPPVPRQCPTIITRPTAHIRQCAPATTLNMAPFLDDTMVVSLMVAMCIAVTTANKGGKEGQGGAKLVFSCGENGLCPPCRWAHPL